MSRRRAGLDVRQDGAERLVELVGQSRRQLAQRGGAGRVGGLRAVMLRLSLGPLARGAVGEHHDRVPAGRAQRLDHHLVPAVSTGCRDAVLEPLVFGALAGKHLFDGPVHALAHESRRLAQEAQVVSARRRGVAIGLDPGPIDLEDAASAIEHGHPRGQGGEYRGAHRVAALDRRLRVAPCDRAGEHLADQLDPLHQLLRPRALARIMNTARNPRVRPLTDSGTASSDWTPAALSARRSTVASVGRWSRLDTPTTRPCRISDAQNTRS